MSNITKTAIHCLSQIVHQWYVTGSSHALAGKRQLLRDHVYSSTCQGVWTPPACSGEDSALAPILT